MALPHNNTLVQTFGILGNIISFCVYLAPLPTFRDIYKKRSTQGYQSVPYLVALFSASLWLYYSILLEKISIPLIVINSVGCFIESFYIIFFIAYATQQAKNLTVKIFVLMNVALFSLIVLVTYYTSHGHLRVKIVGGVCSGISVSVFAAPLCIVVQVIRTRSIEFMPFALSAFLTASSIIWFFYGLFLSDSFIAAPNILGFVFGIIQMGLYFKYRRSREMKKDQNPPETALASIVPLSTPEIHPIDIDPNEHFEDNIIISTK